MVELSHVVVVVLLVLVLLLWILFRYRAIFTHHSVTVGPQPTFFLGNAANFDELQVHRKFLEWSRDYGELMQFTTLGAITLQPTRSLL